MKIKQVDLGQERKIIIRLITSTNYCKRVLPLIKSYYLKSQYSRIISGWVAEYFEKYLEAPEKNIEDVFYNKKSSLSDEEAEEIGGFLRSISEEYEKSDEKENLEFEVEEAKTYLRLQSLEYLSKELQIAVDEKSPDEGERSIAEYSKIIGESWESVSIIRSTKEVMEAFEDEGEFLFKFPAALGEVAGDFHRGDFVSFMAPMKRGKTWMLWYTAEYAMREGLKVVFFTLEMTRKQMIRRGWRSISGLPKEKSEIQIPFFEEENNKFKIRMKTEERRGLDPSKIKMMQEKYKKIIRRGDVRIVQLTEDKSTVSGIALLLDNMAFYEHYEPDVIVIDYADLLQADKSAGNEYRHQLNNIWRGIRNLAKDRNIIAVTASQTIKDTFSRDMRQADTAEDIRKIAHVTSALGLNQKEEEKEKGYIRVKQLAIREGKQIMDQAVVLQCLDIGKAYLDSKFLKDCII